MNLDAVELKVTPGRRYQNLLQAFKGNDSNKNYIEILLGFEQPVLWNAGEKSGNLAKVLERFPDVLTWPKDTKFRYLQMM